MKIPNWILALVASAGLMTTGCSGFWNAVASSTVTTTTLSSGYFFVLNSTSSQILSYYVNAGTLTSVGSYTLSATPIAIAVAPNNDFLYVSTTSGIYLYTISGGTLTLASSTAITTDPATAMQVDATDSWLVEASGSGYLYALPINSSTGQLSSTTLESVPITGSTVNALAIAPDNEYIFVAAGTYGTQAYGFTAANTDPFQSKAYATVAVKTTATGSALSVAVDPSSRLVYVGESGAYSGSGGLRVFTLGTAGALTELTTSPYSSGGTGPHAILPKSSGDYVYVANWNGTAAGNITGFTITDTSSVYSLTALTTSVATGAEPVGLAEDSNDNFILAVSALGNPYFDAYIFDTTTAGVLDTTIKSTTFEGIAVAAAH